MATKPTFSLKLGGYDLTSGELVYTDATGSYNATANPGGYGSPNNPRSAYGLFLLHQRRESTARVTLPSTEPDPLTATEFRCLPGQDGWVQTTLYAVPTGDASVAPPALAPPLTPAVVIPPGPAPALLPLTPLPAPAYVRVDVPTDLFVYDAANGGLNRRYAYLTQAGATVVFWKVVAPVELLDSSYLAFTANELVAVDAPTLRAKLCETCILLDFDLVPNGQEEPQFANAHRAYDQVRLLLEGAAYQWRLGNYYVSQRNLETIASLHADQLLVLP